MRVTVRGGQSVDRDTVVHEDAPNFIELPLLDVFSDPSVITAASALRFTLNVTSEWTGSPGTRVFPVPLHPVCGGAVAAHGASYRIAGTF